jgi:hypothetical protein
VDVDGSGNLDFAEFVLFVRNLRRQTDLDSAFGQYAGGKDAMSADEVLRFLRDYQHETSMTLDDAQALIARFERGTSVRSGVPMLCWLTLTVCVLGRTSFRSLALPTTWAITRAMSWMRRLLPFTKT